MEIQRSDTVDHARRTRCYAAAIDSEYLEKGKEYYEMPDVHIIYISETANLMRYFKKTDPEDMRHGELGYQF